MRSACVLRQLGGCAGSTPILARQWSSRAAPRCTGTLRWELAGCERGGRCKWLLGLNSSRCTNYKTSDNIARSFTTSHTLHESWKITAPTPPSELPATGETLREQLRAVMRLVPHSVVVCTSVITTADPGHGHTARAVARPRGMTMSSFTSLSLDPTPVLALNIAVPSLTLAAIQASRTLNIHVLSGDAEGARVAEWFRRGNAKDLGIFDEKNLREGCGCKLASIADVPLIRKKRRKSQTQAPVLMGKGVLYVLRCSLLRDDEGNKHETIFKVRDHVIVLAELSDVVAIGEDGAEDDRFGLAYADRRYRQLGGTIVKDEEKKNGKSMVRISKKGSTRTAARPSPQPRPNANTTAPKPAKKVSRPQNISKGAGTTSKASSPAQQQRTAPARPVSVAPQPRAQPGATSLLGRVMNMLRGR